MLRMKKAFIYVKLATFSTIMLHKSEDGKEHMLDRRSVNKGRGKDTSRIWSVK